MTLSEAIEKIQGLISDAKARLDGYGFDITTVTDYTSASLRPVSNPESARYISSTLIIGGGGINEGEEYCLTIGVTVHRKTVNDEQFEKNRARFEEMITETVSVLDEHEDKLEGITVLTAKATEEYEKFVAKMDEENQKLRKQNSIRNIILIAIIVVCYIIAIARG